MDKSEDIAAPYNSRLLNQLKKLLREKDVFYIWHKSINTLIIDQYHLVIKPSPDGRFRAYNKGCLHGYKFDFTASSTLEIIVKLMRFRLIPHNLAKDLSKETKKIPQ